MSQIKKKKSRVGIGVGILEILGISVGARVGILGKVVVGVSESDLMPSNPSTLISMVIGNISEYWWCGSDASAEATALFVNVA